jgi:hypothetical protein
MAGRRPKAGTDKKVLQNQRRNRAIRMAARRGGAQPAPPAPPTGPADEAELPEQGDGEGEEEAKE